MLQLYIHLRVTPRQLLRPLAVERDAILAAVHFQRGQVQHILVLADFRIQFVNPLIQPVLLAFHLLDDRRALRFRRVQLFQLLPNLFRRGIQLACLACQHLPHDPAHLVANFRISPRLRRLPLQRPKLLLHLDDDVVHARQVYFRRFQLRFRQPFLGLEFRHARGFFDDRAPLHRLGGKDQPDAPLFDDGVGIRAKPHAHEHFLDVAQARDAAVDEVFALSGTIQPPADHDFAGLRCQHGLVFRFLLSLE